VDEYNETDL